MKPRDQLHYYWIVPMISNSPHPPLLNEVKYTSFRDYLDCFLDYSAYSSYLKKNNISQAKINECYLVVEDENSTIDVKITGESPKIKKPTGEILTFISSIDDMNLKRSVVTVKQPQVVTGLPHDTNDSWAFLVRVDPNAKRTSRKWLYLVLSRGFHSHADETSHQSIMWRDTTPILCAELFSGSHWHNWYFSLRILIEGVIKGEPTNVPDMKFIYREHVNLFFDLTEWLRDGTHRITQEAWKGHHAVEHILQPELEQKVGVFPWKSTKRMGSPSA